jgi:ATP-dependent DNA ligase
VHEIKHDGSTGTRRGHDWTDRHTAIAAAAAKLRTKSFTLDGEAVVCGPDGVALLELDGADLRPLPLGECKTKLARLVERNPPARTRDNAGRRPEIEKWMRPATLMHSAILCG